MAALLNFMPLLMAWQHAGPHGVHVSHSVYSPPPGREFRGFAYFTAWPDGSNSDVAFLRGPAAQRLLEDASLYVRSLLPLPAAVARAKQAAEGTVVGPAHLLPPWLQAPPDAESPVTPSADAESPATPAADATATAPAVDAESPATPAADAESPAPPATGDAETASSDSTENPAEVTEVPTPAAEESAPTEVADTTEAGSDVEATTTAT